MKLSLDESEEKSKQVRLKYLAEEGHSAHQSGLHSNFPPSFSSHRLCNLAHLELTQDTCHQALKPFAS